MTELGQVLLAIKIWKLMQKTLLYLAEDKNLHIVIVIRSTSIGKKYVFQPIS